MSELKRELFPEDETADVSVEGADGTAGTQRSALAKKRRRRRRLTLAVLPTMLTLGNAVCGLASISVAMSVSPNEPDGHALFVAGILIFAGMLFDALDGSAARMTGQESQFGAQLDSLCDAITFGTARL